MYSQIQLAKKYLHYYFSALNGKGHGMHSPFVFDFILNVLNNQSNYYPPPAIENLRKKLLQNEQKLKVTDFGAGSRVQSASEKKVKDIARAAVKPKKYGQLLHRLCRHYGPNTIIELGTSLGISTAYLASANSPASVTTIEGSQEIAAVAQENFGQLGFGNIHSLVGNFDELLPKLLQQQHIVDLAYIDGNHRYAPTINYFSEILEKTDTNSILVFDDIHWSEEMEKAWKEIKDHPSVKCTVDIFFLGFVFFRKEFKTKQHFTIRF